MVTDLMKVIQFWTDDGFTSLLILRLYLQSTGSSHVIKGRWKTACVWYTCPFLNCRVPCLRFHINYFWLAIKNVPMCPGEQLRKLIKKITTCQSSNLGTQYNRNNIRLGNLNITSLLPLNSYIIFSYTHTLLSLSTKLRE